MRVAITDSWPNLKENAEKEFIKRFLIACENLGYEAKVVVTSSDIEAFSPDVVFVSHEFTRKLTAVPTVGLMWSPLSFFKDDPYRVRSVISYDGYLVANDEIKRYLQDLTFGLGIEKPIGSEIFLPTSYKTELRAYENERLSVSYIGVHWDGARHKDIFEHLAGNSLCTFYGPPDSWNHLPGNAYGGQLPFDGKSVQNTIAKHGLALCLHKKEHRDQNTPSMRLFEALSVGAIPICDSIQFARDNCSEFAFFVDTSLTPIQTAGQVRSIIEFANSKPEAVKEMGRKGKEWFEAHWSLERRIEYATGPFLKEVRSKGKFQALTTEMSKPPTDRPGPMCEVIIRTGDRDLSTLRRAIDSVRAANSAECSLGLIVVDYRNRDDVSALCQQFNTVEFPVRYVLSENTGFRSTALWDGLKVVEARYVAHLDDDDTVFPNHYRQLFHTLNAADDLAVAYSGVIKQEDDEGLYFYAANFDGGLGQTIEEQRELQFLDNYDLNRLLTLDNFIQSNAWMARSDVVKKVMGADPELVVVEDMYLYSMLARKGPFAFTGSPTAVWHWRSKKLDNSMNAVKQQVWANCIERLRMRLGNLTFKGDVTYDQALNGIKPAIQMGQSQQRRPLNIEEVVEGGIALSDISLPEGFHAPELPGLWSKAEVSKLVFMFDEAALGEARCMKVEFIGSSADVEGERWVEFQLEDALPSRVTVSDWSVKCVDVKLPDKPKPNMTLFVRSSHLLSTGEDQRQLGVLVKSIQVVRVEAA